jgi:hypothetical protein
MADTAYKSTKLPTRIAGGQPAAARGTSWPSPLMRAPWRDALRAADYIPAARRVVLVQQTGGSGEWAAGNFTVGGGAQEYPNSSSWRTVARGRFMLAPGNALQLRVVAVRSGPTERYIPATGLWGVDAVGGALRAVVTWSQGADTGSSTAQLDLPASNETDSWEPTSTGGSWGALIFRGALLVLPDGFSFAPSEAAKWAERPRIDVEIQHRGGARVICAVLSEVPHTHTVAHDLEAVAVHGWPEQDQGPDLRPQIETRDGVTYEDHRFGPWRSMTAAATQRRSCGPLVASWGAYSEALAEVTDTEVDPISVTSSTFVGVSIGSTITSWATTNPGHSVSGHYARPMPECSPLRARTSASIPVRIRVYARFSAAGSNTGYMKFQSTARSSCLVAISQATVGTTWTWIETTAWLECSTAPDDTYPVLHDFARVTGGTLEIRGWSLEYGWP